MSKIQRLVLAISLSLAPWATGSARAGPAKDPATRTGVGPRSHEALADAAAATRPAEPARAPRPSPAPATTVPATTTPVTAPATAPAALSPEADPAAAFEKALGAEFRRVAATAPAADDLELAKKLMAAAKTAAPTPKYQAFLYEKVTELTTRDRAAYPLALQAMGRLRASRPADAAAWDERILLIYDALYAAAAADERALLLANPYRRKLLDVAVAKATSEVVSPEAREALGSLDQALELCRKASEVARTQGPDSVTETAAVTALVADRQRLVRRLADLRAKDLAGTADAATYQERVAILLAVFNRPVEAVRCAADSPDAKLAPLARRAAAAPATLTDEQAAELGDWYKSLSEKLTGPAQVYLLRRAEAVYAEFLASRPAPSPVRAKVIASASQVGKELDKKPTEPAGQSDRFFGPAVAVQLLPRVTSDACRVCGTWTKRQNDLFSDAASDRAILAVPAIPLGDYEVTAEFASQGATAVGFSLPVATASVDVLRHDADCGIGMVQGAWNDFGAGGAGGSKRLPLAPLAKDTGRHTLYAKVTRGGTPPAPLSVTIKVDGEAVGRWEGAAADLAPQPRFALPKPTLIGLCADGGRVVFSSVALNMLSGSAPRPEELSPAPSTDLPPDGSRPADAVVSVPAPTAAEAAKVASIHHDLVSLIVDDSKGQRSVRVTLADPSNEFRVVHNGFVVMMAAPANVAPLRIGIPEYQRLKAMSQSAPGGYTDADIALLGTLYHDYEAALSDDAKSAAEHKLFTALHRLGEQYRKATAGWPQQVRQGCNAAEFQLILKFGKPYFVPNG